MAPVSKIWTICFRIWIYSISENCPELIFGSGRFIVWQIYYQSTGNEVKAQRASGKAS